MMIYSDFRKKGFQNKVYVYALVKPNCEVIERTRLDVFPCRKQAMREKGPNDFIVRMKKTTVQKLKRVHPFKCGWYLTYNLRNRESVAHQQVQ